MDSGNHILEQEFIDADVGCYRRERAFAQADGPPAPERRSKLFLEYPLKLGRTAGIDPDPPRIAVVDANRHLEAPVFSSERQNFSFSNGLGHAQEANATGGEIDLHDVAREKVRAEQSVYQ